MTQPKKKTVAKKKAATKRKPAARRPPEPEIQVNRMTDSPAPPVEEREQTQEERDAAGAARREQVMSASKNNLDQYEQVHEPLEHAEFDHHAAEAQRQAELQAERDTHNERTGDASL